MSNRCDEIHAPREVLENRLLAELGDHDKVAIVADWKLLSFLIYAANCCPAGGGYTKEYRERLVADLRQLATAAFGKEPR